MLATPTPPQLRCLLSPEANFASRPLAACRARAKRTSADFAVRPWMVYPQNRAKLRFRLLREPWDEVPALPARESTAQKFCGECGARLAAACPACGASNPAGQRFCGECGASLDAPPTSRFASPQQYTPKHLAERILPSKDALEGERKQVTVLFADLKGSMELIADRDPEEARKLLDPVLEKHDRGGAPLRGHGQPGAWATGSWRCSARRSRSRITPCALAMRRSRCRRPSAATASSCVDAQGVRGADPRRAQLRRGRGARHQQRSAHGLHRDGRDHASRCPNGTAGRAGDDAADGATRCAG